MIARLVAAVLGIQTANSTPPKQIGLVRAGVLIAGIMKHLADLDTAVAQLVAGSHRTRSLSQAQQP
jgi:hypothetical protein